MTPEERIGELEQKVVQLHDMLQRIGGGDRMYQAVVVALMESHPNPEAMAAAVTHYLEKQFVSIHFQTLTTSHIEGAEAARTWLSAVVAETLRRQVDGAPFVPH